MKNKIKLVLIVAGFIAIIIGSIVGGMIL